MTMLRQIVRFGVAGVLTNAAGYTVYLLLTVGIGFEPKRTMTVLYGIGVLLSFAANRYWVFGSNDRLGPAFRRFLLGHVLGYSVNWLLLWGFVDRLGYPHFLVQAAAILVVAGLMFVFMRWFVFPLRPTGAGRPA
ncbi:MAG: GtrA family protein [Ramlibacter sp.]